MIIPPLVPKELRNVIRHSNFNLLISLFFLLSISNFNQEKPNVLIIGDSISIGYFPFVEEALAEQANVVHNPGNARHTGIGLQQIDAWLGDKNWDVIHFNWGLHDLCYRHPDAKAYGNRDKINGTVELSPEAYGENLEVLVERLKLTQAELVFVTTSYVPPGEAGRIEGDEMRYNAVAKAIMKKHGIKINDIHSYSKKVHARYKRKSGDVHFTKEGSEKLAKKITKSVRKALRQSNKKNA